MPSQHTNLPSILLMLDWTSKVYIDSNKYCFMTINVVFLGNLTNPRKVTVDKGKIKMIRGMKTVTSIYLTESYFGLPSFSQRHIKNSISNVATTTQYTERENYICTNEAEMQFWEIKKKIHVALPLLPNCERYFQVQFHFYTNRGA